MKKIRFYNIQWDTDGAPPTSLGLPAETTLEVAEDCDVEEDGADVLSDKFSFCVFGFDFEEVK